MELMAKDLAVTMIAPDGTEWVLAIPSLKIDTEILEVHDGPSLVVDNADTHVPRDPRYMLHIEGECFKTETGLVYTLMPADAGKVNEIFRVE